MTVMHVAAMLLASFFGGLLVWWREGLYLYDSVANCYRAKNAVDFDDESRRHLFDLSRGPDSPLSAKFASLRMHIEVVSGMRSLASVPTTYDQPCWLRNPPEGETVGKRTSRFIAFLNGILDIDRWILGHPDYLMPPTADFFTLMSVDYAFDPHAKCPLFDAFLRFFTNGDHQAARLLQEFAGLCLIPEHRYQRCLVLVGDGANGKSVFTLVLRHLVGTRNCSSLSLGQLAGAHGLAAMVDKLLNISDELDETDKADEALIKTITGGQAVSINPKYKTAFSTVLPVRFVFATNTLPHVRDRTDGFWRRLLLITCTLQWPEDKQDRDLPTKLLAELSGIMNWALEGLKRLREQDGFTEVFRSELAIEQHRNDCNPVREFLRERAIAIPPDVDIEPPTPAIVITRFKTWCEELGKNSKYTGPSIGKEIARMFPNVVLRQRREGTRRWRVYEGMAFVEDVETSFDYRFDDSGQIVKKERFWPLPVACH